MKVRAVWLLISNTFNLAFNPDHLYLLLLSSDDEVVNSKLPLVDTTNF